MKTVIYHSADFDGVFCREIAKKFLGTEGVNYIGWNFGDAPLPITDGEIYVLDLPVDRIFGITFSNREGQYKISLDKGCDSAIFLKDQPLRFIQKTTWIDHHKSSIETHPTDIPGYRIDGVAACRLAWQWFTKDHKEGKHGECLPTKAQFVARSVDEPLAVRLAGEYDVWDHRGDGDLEFQYGLRTLADGAYDFEVMLKQNENSDPVVKELIERGEICRDYARNMDAMWLSESWHIIEWEGLKFLAQNSVQRGSGILDSKDKPGTGHDALMLYGFRGKLWTVSLYHAKHRTDIDLSKIAVKYGGGGHRGACGFTCQKLPFVQT